MKTIINTTLALMLSGQALTAFAATALGCLIEPSQIAQVGSQVVGVTESVNVERGDIVQKGQILATLKSDYERANVDIAKTRSQLEADVRSAEANLELARITEKRGVDLVQKKFLSQQALDKSHAETVLAEQRLAFAKEQLRISGGELNVARAQLGLRSIRAPFDGIVAERFVWPGERVEDKPLFKIVKINPLRVEIVAPVELYGQVEKSQIIQIKPDLANTGSVDAKVVLVDKVIDGASNTFRIRAEIDNQTAEIPSGLRCKAMITPNTVAKAPNGVPKVSDSPVALNPQATNKHSFELKPLGEVMKSEPQTKNLGANPSGLGLPNSQFSQQQPMIQQPLGSAKNQFSLRMDKSVPMPSSPPVIKMPSDKGAANSPAISIEEQFRQLQQQRDAVKNGTYKPTSVTPTTSATPRSGVAAYQAKVVAYQSTPVVTAQSNGGVAYPSALAPQVIRQVTPMPAGFRRITNRDAMKTFPIRRVVALAPNAVAPESLPATWQNQQDDSANVSAIKVNSDWQSNIAVKDDLTFKPKLKMDRALFGYGGRSSSTSFQSN